MVRASAELEEFERTWLTTERLDLKQAILIVEAAVALARALGVWPGPDPLSGIETDIHLAKVINARKTS